MKVKRVLLATVFLTVAVGGGWVTAQTASPMPMPKPDVAAPAHDHGGAAKAPGGGAPMCGGMMGNGMMAGGMMGGGVGSMMMGAAGTKVAVKNLDKGVTITLTSTDAATVTRIQKMAEAMRLMHEAMNP